MAYQPQVLPVVDGGTGLNSTTANQLLYSSATNTLAGLANGTTGQILTATTGNAPSWGAAPAPTSGNLVLIQKQTPVSQTSIQFTSIPNTYDVLQLVFYGVTASGTDSLVGRFSYNNGVSYLSDATYVLGLQQATSAGSGGNWASGQTLFIVSNQITALSGGSSSGITYFYNVTKGTFYPSATGTSVNVGVNYEFYLSGSSYTGSIGAVNAIQIFSASSSTFSGTFKLYGVVN